MKEILDKILALMLFFSILGITYCKKIEAKYVIEEENEAIFIEKADTEAPSINGNNCDVDYQNYNQNVTITYEDNLKVKYAKYWYNSEEKEFLGEGIDFDSGIIFSISGWYKIEVSDMYENVTTYIFMLDKEVDSICLSSSDITDDGATLTITAMDKLSGIKELNLYINDMIYKTYTYNDSCLKNVEEEIYVNIDDLPFYEEAYVVAFDCYGNSKSSDAIIPNKNRIYDLIDFIKFRDVSKENHFSGETIYLLNDIDLSSVCSTSIGSWEQIGIATFYGIFEGNNHTISNFYMNSTNTFGGLFRQINLGGGIQNLNLTGKIVSAGNYTGAFVGNILNGFIKNCTSTVSITSNSNFIGGIAGIIQDGTQISYCINKGTVSGNTYIGGITGYNNGGYIEYCGNIPKIAGSGQYVGGVVRI